MKNFVLLVITIALMVSCKKEAADTFEEPLEKNLKEDKIMESDKDDNGCLTSAGYTWSKFNSECIRLSDVAISLNPVLDPKNEDTTLMTYIIISSDGTEAEVFFPAEEESKIFTRISEGKPWLYEDWQLEAFEGFRLKKQGKTMYTGDGEIGPKVTGSDKIEN